MFVFQMLYDSWTSENYMFFSTCTPEVQVFPNIQVGLATSDDDLKNEFRLYWHVEGTNLLELNNLFLRFAEEHIKYLLLIEMKDIQT
jgi:hypothetical protein